MYKTLQIIGYLPYQLVQDFFHQQYQKGISTTIPFDAHIKPGIKSVSRRAIQMLLLVEGCSPETPNLNMGVSKIGVPKMDGENKGKPYYYFWKHPYLSQREIRG